MAHGVTPIYIPFAEPWRNGVVEHFNGTFDKQFFRAERFPTPGRMAARYAEFTAFHNARHCYSALGGLTPDQAEARADVTPIWPRSRIWACRHGWPSSPAASSPSG